MSHTTGSILDLPVVSVSYGGMGCGKTEEMIRAVRRLRLAKKRVTVATHKTDTRYGVGTVMTHNKDGMPALAVSSLLQIHSEQLADADYLAVDEVQFFDHLYDDMMALHERHPNLRFIFAGLATYSNGRPFGDLHRIIPWARSKQLTAVCMFCSSESATMTACTKVKASDLQVGEVNDTDSGYYAACVSCWSRHSKS